MKKSVRVWVDFSYRVAKQFQVESVYSGASFKVLCVS